MKKGIQIIYVPNHARGDITHPDTEQGFVMAKNYATANSSHYCRFWNTLNRLELRTKANSELVMDKNIVVQTFPFSHDQEFVNKTIKAIEASGS